MAIHEFHDVLEADYKHELGDHFGIVFNKLYTITNLPISRFASWLRNRGQYEQYLDLLIRGFHPGDCRCRARSVVAAR
jgi:hypothetical protein